MNDFVITVATANGSGSQSSNNVLLRALFRMGLPVGGKNLFPSNIQGLPTWFTIRANEHGFTGRKKFADIIVALNPQTVNEDLSKVREYGFAFVAQELKIDERRLPAGAQLIRVPFKELAQPLSDSVKLRKLLINMIYVGLLAELLEIPEACMQGTIEHQFADKPKVLASNAAAIAAGRKFAREHLTDVLFPFKAVERPNQNLGKVLIDGNSAGAIGLLYGGCTVVAWYPITPSSSLIETFQSLAERYRIDKDGKKNFAVLQAEDELASIAMVLGAGWTGARAMTATSGPGLSLMAEAAGLAYYAEIPSVIWDVQRVGPSTGLPTRTMQGDLLCAYYLSHGDTRHVVLLPGTPNECFEFAQCAFDLAESLQTLVLVLTDLDIGMNLHVAQKFDFPENRFLRGKTLDAEGLQKAGGFKRYADVDHDGVPYRTLPGTAAPGAAYFTRGTGHDEAGVYSEDAQVYRDNMDRLARKFETARTMVPKSRIDNHTSHSAIGLITYGSSHEAVGEARFLLQQKGIFVNCLRLRALPFTDAFEDFVSSHERVYIIEQNRDAQLMMIVRAELPEYHARCHSVLQYDGMPLDAEYVYGEILKREVPSES